MPIRVARGIRSRMREYPGSITLQVRGADPDKAAAALGAAGREIEATMDTNYVGTPLPTPAGPFLWLDAKAVTYRQIDTLTDIVARHLSEAGIEDAEIASPERGGPLSGLLETAPRGVVLRLYPPPPPLMIQPPPAQIPDAWLEAATAWVSEGMAGHDEVRAAIEVMEFPLPVASVGRFLAQARAAQALGAIVVAGDAAQRMRGVNGSFLSVVPNLALASGGPGADDADLIRDAEVLADIARGLAPQLAYAVVSFTPGFGAFRALGSGGEWVRLGGVVPGGMTDWFLEEIVLDAFPWQVLGPGHLARLGGTPPGARPLAGGRVELPIGEWASWLWDPAAQERLTRDPIGEDPAALRRDPGIGAEGRRLLAPCVMTQLAFAAFREERLAKAESNKRSNESGGAATT